MHCHHYHREADQKRYKEHTLNGHNANGHVATVTSPNGRFAHGHFADRHFAHKHFAQWSLRSWTLRGRTHRGQTIFKICLKMWNFSNKIIWKKQIFNYRVIIQKFQKNIKVFIHYNIENYTVRRNFFRLGGPSIWSIYIIVNPIFFHLHIRI